MDATLAKKFTEAWIQAWNDHNLEAILSHYADELVFSSPLIPLLGFNESGIIRSKEELRRYFQMGLNAYPYLHFQLRTYYRGVGTLVICYTSVNNREAAEVFRLNAEGKAGSVFCNYE